MDSIFKKTAKAFIGFGLLFFKVKIFRKDIIFNNKRIAIVGPASSALENENGFLIDGFDYVVRINKALITWNTENEKFLGTRTDILFHNFHENFDRGGGGTIGRPEGPDEGHRRRGPFRKEGHGKIDFHHDQGRHRAVRRPREDLARR